jgi:tight adherence protein B
VATVKPRRTTARARLRAIQQGNAKPVRRRAGLGHHVERVVRAAGELPQRQATLAAVVVVACVATLAGGPVAGFVGGAYTAIGIRAVFRHRCALGARRGRAELLDRIAGLAAELRAGRSASAAIQAAGLRAHRTARPAALAEAAAGLAERTGAPLADLVERIEADARVTDRALATADAQAAGARATAMLLAALPAGGIALGYGIGVQPLDVLLGTPIGAACSAGTVVLHVLGLAWTARLAPRLR